MAIFTQLTSALWSYVSPRKTGAQPPTPKTAPPFVKQQRQQHVHKGSLRQLTRDTRSMSPNARVDSWRATSELSPAPGAKRKRSSARTTEDNRKQKARRMSRQEDSDDEMELEEDEVGMEYDSEDEVGHHEIRVADDRNASELSSLFSSVRMQRTPTPTPTPTTPIPEDYFDDSESDIDVDNTSVVDELTYQESTPKTRKLRTLPAEQEALGVSDTDLRDAGWDDDHVTLVQKLKLRGHEPLLPQHWHFSFRFWPDALFAADDDAFVSSVREDHFKAEKALEKLLDLGSFVRDSLVAEPPRRPDLQVRKALKAYLKWALVDSQLDSQTAIPVLAVVTRPANAPALVLQEKAARKLKKLADRYHSAFRAVNSTEGSPASKASSQLSYPVPTLYAIIASATLVALTVYTPEDPRQSVKPVAFFDFKDSNYDAWNSLALAIIVCHVRNVQMAIAEDTGLGMKEPGMIGMDEESDPDL